MLLQAGSVECGQLEAGRSVRIDQLDTVGLVVVSPDMKMADVVLRAGRHRFYPGTMHTLLSKGAIALLDELDSERDPRTIPDLELGHAIGVIEFVSGRVRRRIGDRIGLSEQRQDRHHSPRSEEAVVAFDDELIFREG